MPDGLTVMLLTYSRPEYAERTLKSTLSNLRYSGYMSVHIADDGSPQENYIKWLCEIASDYVEEVTFTNAGHMGYGQNYNLACQVVHPRCKYVLPLEDDWELVRELDVDPFVEALSVFGCIRMGYVGYTQRLIGEFESVAGSHYLRLLPDSPEPHVFAGHPRIETVDWARSVGPWPIDNDPGTTEFMVAHRPAARQNVAWPVDAIKPYGDAFCHIGTVRSY